MDVVRGKGGGIVVIQGSFSRAQKYFRDTNLKIFSGQTGNINGEDCRVC